jgi:hypothetical protein
MPLRNLGPCQNHIALQLFIVTAVRTADPKYSSLNLSDVTSVTLMVAIL